MLRKHATLLVSDLYVSQNGKWLVIRIDDPFAVTAEEILIPLRRIGVVRYHDGGILCHMAHAKYLDLLHPSSFLVDMPYTEIRWIQSTPLGEFATREVIRRFKGEK